MYKHSASNDLTVGSRSSWLLMRIGQAFVTLILLLFIPSMIQSSRAFLGVFATIILYTFAEAHRVVYGHLDEGGIHYRRYFRWSYVGWERIQSIRKQPIAAISVDLEGHSLLDRHLFFIQNFDLFKVQSEFATFEHLRGAWVRAKATGRSSLAESG